MPDASDRISLPIRVHEFMLACAGRLDDDALTDARELLAVAELDRAVELLAVSLVAGRIAVTADERDQLRSLLDAVRSSTSLADRIVVDEAQATPRHRFTVGVNGDPAAEAGVGEAIGRVVEVLPDIRTVSCVWRTTPSGATSGPVPQRIVLVETGPDGFAPSTAYRVEQALRRAGVRAAVEVLQAGGDLTGYHREALASARRIPLRTASAAQAPPGPAAPSRPTPPPAPEPAVDPEDSSFVGPPAPRPVTTTRRRTAAHADKRPTGESATGRWQQRIAAAEAAQTEPGTPAVPSVPSGPPIPSVPSVSSPAEQPVPPSAPAPSTSVGMSSAAGMTPVVPPPDTSSPTRPSVSRPEPSAPQIPTPPAPQADPQPALAAETGTSHAPAPTARTSSTDTGSTSSKDAELSQREQELLRQLHEELAKREQAGPERGNTASWQVDRSAQRPGMYSTGTDYGTGSWHSSQDQTAVNGIPPYGSQPPERSGH